MQLSSLYEAKVMAIPDFFKEFLRIFIQENSKIQNFEYKVMEDFNTHKMTPSFAS
jgi:hypothetical protein